MNIDNLIRNWHIKASDDDYFSKFIFEYLAFIAFLKKKKFTDTRLDREAIQKLKRDDETKREYFSELSSNSAATEAWNKIIKELNNVRLGNISRNGDGTEEIKWWNSLRQNLSRASVRILPVSSDNAAYLIICQAR
ncbi:MAG TPA: hypothetical protein ENI76_01120 [Ignavibacteria bacterium]|nr:hypothetical protein [Ignavibacteria bacterium]